MYRYYERQEDVVAQKDGNHSLPVHANQTKAKKAGITKSKEERKGRKEERTRKSYHFDGVTNKAQRLRSDGLMTGGKRVYDGTQCPKYNVCGDTGLVF